MAPVTYMTLTPSFLQDCHLAGVIELMLRDAVQHVIEVVAFSGNAIAQARIR